MTSSPFNQLSTQTEITYLKGVGPVRGDALKEFGINTTEDILHHFPRRYLDRTTVNTIQELRVGDESMIVGQVQSFNVRKMKNRSFYQMTLKDETGYIKCVWFQGVSWMTSRFEEGDTVAIYGKVEFYNGFQMVHPEFDILDPKEDPLNTGQIISLYSSSAKLKSVGLDSRGIRKIIKTLINSLGEDVKDHFGREFRKQQGISTLLNALQNIHFPRSAEALQTALYRLKFDEHFFLQLLMALRKKGNEKKTGRVYDKQGPYVKKIYNRIPFTLTSSQINVLREIRQDLKETSPMNRLLQGDVGSGKTIVAMLSASIVIGNNAQVAVMAPTEILAKQHHLEFKKHCDDAQIVTALLTGGLKKSERNKILEGLENGKIQLVVGTHALIQKDIKFEKLGMLIIDEQHRFGVDQRKTLIEKGIHPEVLAMTATPIPRTLAMTYHGDMDVSIINEMPKNRIPIKTHIVEPSRLEKVYDFVRKEVNNKKQCFIVYPLIENSEKMDLKAANVGFELIEKLFPQFNIGYVHGKMKADERESQMNAFKANKLNILVSTTVIEVGIDIPNATVMIIENAERFGLSQLHQLRGRIGRGDQQGYCVLVQRKHTPDADHRLRIMSNTTDGFVISEEDLKLRGPGEFFSTKQHGYIKTKLADMMHDGEIIRPARQCAFDIVSEDPQLQKPKHKEIRKIFIRDYKEKLDFIKVG